MPQNEENPDEKPEVEIENDERINFNPEHHILIEDAIKIKRTFN